MSCKRVPILVANNTASPTLALNSTDCSVLYLAVGDGIKQFADLLWLVDLILSGGERVRGGQGIDGKHPVHIVQDDQIFLREENAESRNGAGSLNNCCTAKLPLQRLTVNIKSVSYFFLPVYIIILIFIFITIQNNTKAFRIERGIFFIVCVKYAIA